MLSKRHFHKVECILLRVLSILPHAEFGQNDHREDAPHFTRSLSRDYPFSIYESSLSKQKRLFLKCSIFYKKENKLIAIKPI